MNKPSKDPLDQLFETLAEARFETPPASFIQDVEARLDAQQKKRRKPLAVWWVWSAFGAVLFLGILYGSKLKSAESSNTAKATASSMQAHLSKNSNSSAISKSVSASKSTASIQTKQTFLNAKLFQPISLTPTAIAAISESYAISSADPHFSAPLQRENQQNSNPITADTNERVALILSQDVPIQPVAPVITQSMASPSSKVGKHAIGLQFGVSAIFSSYAVPSENPAIPGYSAKQFREAREMGERQTSSWDFNLRYQLGIGAWQLQTGIHYLEWGEQLQYDVISVEGTNRYKYIQVPLLLGRPFHFGKIGLTPFLGAAYAHGLTTNGTYIQPLNNGVSLVSAKANNWNALAQLELSYQILPQLIFTSTPFYRQTLGLLVDNGLIMNRYHSFGLLSGFIYRF